MNILRFLSSFVVLSMVVASPFVALAQTTQAPTITRIQSAANPAGTISAGQRASIYGTGLSGRLTITIGRQEAQTVSVTGISDTYAEFVVPSRAQQLDASITVTNAAGLTSNFYAVMITVPTTPTTQAPTITRIQSAANPTGTISAGQRASIYGTGLSGKLTVTIGRQEPQMISVTGISDTYAEFVVPSRAQQLDASITVTNAAGLTSNFYAVMITVPTTPTSQAPTTQAPTNPSTPNTGINNTDIDTESSTACLVLNNNLRYRSRDGGTNGEVSSLQDFLQAKGYLNSEPTGYFGLLTLSAVKDFQRANNISPTGFVGSITRAAIKELSCK